MKTKNMSRRTYYWAFPSHLRSGKLLLLDPKRIAKEMVRVRITLAPKKP